MKRGEFLKRLAGVAAFTAAAAVVPIPKTEEKPEPVVERCEQCGSPAIPLSVGGSLIRPNEQGVVEAIPYVRNYCLHCGARR